MLAEQVAGKPAPFAASATADVAAGKAYRDMAHILAEGSGGIERFTRGPPTLQAGQPPVHR